MGELVVAKRVYKNYLIMLPNRVSYVELVELDILDLILYWVWISCMLALPLLIVGQRW